MIPYKNEQYLNIINGKRKDIAATENLILQLPNLILDLNLYTLHLILDSISNSLSNSFQFRNDMELLSSYKAQPTSCLRQLLAMHTTHNNLHPY